MRVGLLYERKCGFPAEFGDPDDINSELLSEEEENELLSGLRDAGHEVVRIGDARSLVNRVGFWRNRCDLVFNRSVGYRGIERKLIAPGVLEAAGMPYLGSTPYVLTLTRHKLHAKLIARNAGLHTPDAVLFPGATSGDLSTLRYPVIVKPVAESSSIGIEPEGSVVSSPEEAKRRAQVLFERYQQPALVETFVEGAEIEVPLVVDPAPRALGAVSITLDGRPVEGRQFLAADTVYDDGYNFAGPPSYVDSPRVARAAEYAAAALGLRDYGRIDFRVTRDGTPWFIEASSHPHLQRHSSFYVIARGEGLAYWAMLDRLVGIAARRCGLPR